MTNNDFRLSEQYWNMWTLLLPCFMVAATVIFAEEVGTSTSKPYGTRLVTSQLLLLLQFILLYTCVRACVYI